MASIRSMAARTSGQSVTSSGSMLSSTSLPTMVQPGTRALSPRLVGHVLVITSGQLPSVMRVLRASTHVPSGGDAPASGAAASPSAAGGDAPESRASLASCGRHEMTWSAMTQAPVTPSGARNGRMTDCAFRMCAATSPAFSSSPTRELPNCAEQRRMTRGAARIKRCPVAAGQ
jgi:hypothetical protein